MKEYKVEVGRVVEGIAGRDKGRYFVIWSIISKEYVEIVNGKSRKLEKPKKKKIKHLKLKQEVMENVADKKSQGQPIYDPEIKAQLRAFYEN